MPNPLLIGGLIVGGTLAAWTLVRRERHRLREMLKRLALQQADDGDPGETSVPLERDPRTGIYRPVNRRRG